MKRNLLTAIVLTMTWGAATAPRALALGGSANISNPKLNGVPIFSDQDLLNNTNLAPNPVITTAMDNLSLTFDAWGDTNFSSVTYTFTDSGSSTTAITTSPLTQNANTGVDSTNTIPNSVLFTFSSPGIWQGTLGLAQGFLSGPLTYQGPSTAFQTESNPIFTLDLNVVPEPASALALLGAGLAGCVRRRRR